MAKKIWVYPTGKVFVDNIPAIPTEVDERLANDLCSYRCGDDFAFTTEDPSKVAAVVIDKENV